MLKKWIDGSRWQELNDPDAVVADGVEGVAWRLCVGNYYTDRTYEFAHEQFAHRLPFLAYVVNKPSHSVSSQIDRVKLSLDGRMPDGFVLDAELHDNKTRPVVRQNCYEMASYLKSYGLPTVIYTRATWWDVHVGPTTWASEYIPWMAHYYYPWVKEPNVAIGWDSWGMWQHSDRGKVDGIGNNVDLNWVKPEVHSLFANGEQPLKQEVIVSYNAQAVEVVLDGS